MYMWFQYLFDSLVEFNIGSIMFVSIGCVCVCGIIVI